LTTITSIIVMPQGLGLPFTLLILGYFITLTLALGPFLVALLLLVLVGFLPISIVPVLGTST
jgi:hypothetical protein